MRPESELVLCGARVHPDATHAARMGELLSRSLDWSEVLRLVSVHRVHPTFARNLEAVIGDLDSAVVPADRIRAIRERVRANATVCMFVTAELLRLTRLLDEGGVRTVHFKGPVLAAVAYGNPALREYVDLDVLVRPDDVRKVREILLASGYRSSLDPAHEERHLETSYWIAFTQEDGPARVDLHWNLADPFLRFTPDLDGLWSRVRTVRMGGADLNTLDAEDTVVALAVHGFKHGYGQLKWVCDLCEWIRSHPDLCWTGILAAARELHVERVLAVSLLLVHEFDEGVAPPDVLAGAARDPVAVRLATEVWGRILAGSNGSSGWRLTRFLIRGRERWRDGWSYLARRWRTNLRQCFVPNENDRAAIRLPAGLGVLYWVVRPLRLLARSVSRRIDRQ